MSTIGLVLGGGGSRGLAHIGALQVLKRAGITIDFIVGTSIGGIVGALYAHGMAPDDIAERVAQLSGGSFFFRSFFSARGRQRILQDYLAEELGTKHFADLDIPLTVMAADMRHGQEVKLSQGPLIPALCATSAVPAVFPPVEIDGRELADGGVIDSLATHVAYEYGADIVLAIDVYPPLETSEVWNDPLQDIMGFASPFTLFSVNDMPSMISATWRAVRVMTWYLHQKRLEMHPPHLLLRPSVTDYGSLDFRDVQGPLLAGVTEMERYLPKLQALIAGADSIQEDEE